MISRVDARRPPEVEAAVRPTRVAVAMNSPRAIARAADRCRAFREAIAAVEARAAVPAGVTPRAARGVRGVRAITAARSARRGRGRIPRRIRRTPVPIRARGVPIVRTRRTAARPLSSDSIAKAVPPCFPPRIVTGVASAKRPILKGPRPARGRDPVTAEAAIPAMAGRSERMSISWILPRIMLARTRKFPRARPLGMTIPRLGPPVGNPPMATRPLILAPWIRTIPTSLEVR
mmetsp:Transcript_12356/g.26285  ORF Transcript_12356/g.26285 Transcript_12356/m.26285 type:complete len:233 (-) Transcript_12356:2064-2762(-)